MTNDVSAQLLLAFLNDAWESAADAANTLRGQIVVNQVNALALVKQGSIASVGKNSANQSYKTYGPGSLTQVQIVEAWGNLLAFYDQIKSKLTSEFEASADFEYSVPAGYDFDPVIYELLTNVFTNVSSGRAASLPDISQIRYPLMKPLVESLA